MNRSQFKLPLLDTGEAAKLLGCTPAALIKFRTERRGPPFVRVGKLVRYRRADLSRWLRSSRVMPKTEFATRRREQPGPSGTGLGDSNATHQQKRSERKRETK